MTGPPEVPVPAAGARRAGERGGSLNAVSTTSKIRLSATDLAPLRPARRAPPRLKQTLPTTTVAQAFATAAGFTWPLAGKGIAGFAAFNETTGDAGADAGTTLNGVAGATLSITPTAGKGPVYLGTTSLPDTTATATASNGAGFFGDLPPGTYTLKITPPSGTTCKRGKKQGWAAGSDDQIKIEVIADYVVSAVGFLCQ